MRSNFAQPEGGHDGVFRHAYTPTDEERIARARGWLAAGGTLIRTAYADPDRFQGAGVCWWVRTAEGRCLDGLAQRIAEAVVDGGGLERMEAGATVTLFRVRAA